MKAITYPTLREASAFLDGVAYVNDSSISGLGIRQRADGSVEALLDDLDAIDDSSEQVLPLFPAASEVMQPSTTEILRAKYRTAFERGYQLSLGEAEQLPGDDRCPYFRAGCAAARRELVEGGGRDASNSSDEYWLEFLELRLLELDAQGA